MADAPPYDQEDFYVVTPILAIAEFLDMDETAIDVIHRPQCPLISDFPNWAHATEADQALGTWQDDFCFIDRSGPDPRVIYYEGSPFEVLCQMYRHDRVTWFHCVFCPECIGVEHNANEDPMVQFLQMMPDDDFKDVLIELADIIFNNEMGHTAILSAHFIVMEAKRRIGRDFFPPTFV